MTVYPVSIIVLSDRAHSGERPDACIPVVKDVLLSHSLDVDDSTAPYLVAIACSGVAYLAASCWKG